MPPTRQDRLAASQAGSPQAGAEPTRCAAMAVCVQGAAGGLEVLSRAASLQQPSPEGPPPGSNAATGGQPAAAAEAPAAGHA